MDAAQVVAFDIGISGSGDRLDEMENLRVLPDGRILAIGGAQYDGSDWDMAVGMVKDNGSGGLEMDVSFSADGRHTVNFDLPGSSNYDNAAAVIIDNTGNIVLVGWCHSSSGNRIAVSRIDKDTSAYDPTFNSTGKATYFHKPLLTDPELPAMGVAVTLTATGFAVGAVVTDSPFRKIGILGLLSDGSVDMPFGTNGWYTSAPTYPGTLWTDTSSVLTGLATDYDRIIFSASIEDPNDPNQRQGLVGLLDMGGNPDTLFSPAAMISTALNRPVNRSRLDLGLCWFPRAMLSTWQSAKRFSSVRCGGLPEAVRGVIWIYWPPRSTQRVASSRMISRAVAPALGRALRPERQLDR